ncbi:MAG: type II toxin-antitoxin system VapC family toxin [Planctomycetes bacterium]|nr:type II toxin-antitoxin system VapC family toxin [Planctomycetota bacterium]
MPVLKVSDEAGNLAEILVNSGTIPQEHSEDALHIALVTVNGIDMSALLYAMIA